MSSHAVQPCHSDTRVAKRYYPAERKHRALVRDELYQDLHEPSFGSYLRRRFGIRGPNKNFHDFTTGLSQISVVSTLSLTFDEPHQVISDQWTALPLYPYRPDKDAR